MNKNIWLKNSEGEPDAMLTLAVIGFAVCLLKVLLGGIEFEIVEKHSWSLGSVDAATVAAILGPTLGAYVARRHTDKKFAPKEEETETEEK